MKLWSALTRTAILILAVLLTACASSPPRTSSSAPSAGSGRYQMKNDSPLLEPIDLSKVRPVVPKAERRTLAGNKSPYTVNGRTYRVMASEEGYAETGMASWYGRKFHGHLTSNGEVYDMFQISAAHTTLPIPSYIRVTNLDNGKSIVARVNDRGPFHTGRVVDLSYAGAVMLDYAGRGTARVKVEALMPGTSAPQPPSQTVAYAADPVETRSTERQLLDEPDPILAIIMERQLIDQDVGDEFLQVGAFSSAASAHTLVGRLARMTMLPVFVHSEPGNGGNVLHKVRIGPLAEDAPVQNLIDSVQAAGLGTPFRVRIRAQ